MLKRTPGTRPTVLPPRTGRADPRQSTTMREMLVWAYKRQMVRHCEGTIYDDRGPQGGGGSNTSAVCRVLATGIVGSGPVARVTRVPVHADAEWVHGLVRSLDKDEFWLVVKAAEADDVPDWNPQCAPLRVVPILKANGKPRMIVCPIEKRPVACRIEVRGVPADEAETIRTAARERYAHWYRLLWAMREKINEEDTLLRWKIMGIGADAEPWRTA